MKRLAIRLNLSQGSRCRWLLRISACRQAQQISLRRPASQYRFSRYSVVVEVPLNHAIHPLAPNSHGFMPSSPQCRLDGVESRSHLLPHRQADDLESPCLSVPQQCVNPRKSNVWGLHCPRRLRLVAANRPNSISRVFFALRVSPNLASRSCIAVRNRLAVSSLFESNILSSA